MVLKITSINLHAIEKLKLTQSICRTRTWCRRMTVGINFKVSKVCLIIPIIQLRSDIHNADEDWN